MRLLFVHQNFPGQFVHLAKELVRRNGVRAVAIHYDNGRNSGRAIPDVELVGCGAPPTASDAIHPWLRDFDRQIRYGHATAVRARSLKRNGFTPDLIVGHPGWGETLFLKDIWPESPLLSYQEYFYCAEGADVGFDPEFETTSDETAYRLRVKNTSQLHALATADCLWTPTEWQRGRLPPQHRSRARVVHDGIDTNAARPNPAAKISINTADGGKLDIRAGDEIVTFVNRNLEPFRGFHIFMRALPEILRRRPKARVILVGGDEASYGLPPKHGGTWRELMLREVGAGLDPSRLHFVVRVPKSVFLQLLQVSALHVYLTYPFVLSWSFLEAMSAGCRILASRTAPITEFIQDGVNGTLFDFFRPDELAAKAVEILQAPARFEPQRLAARETILQRCDLRTVCLPAQLKLVDLMIQRT